MGGTWRLRHVAASCPINGHPNPIAKISRAIYRSPVLASRYSPAYPSGVTVVFGVLMAVANSGWLKASYSLGEIGNIIPSEPSKLLTFPPRPPELPPEFPPKIPPESPLKYPGTTPQARPSSPLYVSPETCCVVFPI